MSSLTPPFIIAVLLALTVHECAHGLVALWLGDTTAKEEGRLTLNPLAHLDLLGTLMFLTVGFGWAKPVPIDPRAFRHEQRDVALTALAGPASNFLLAILTVLLTLIARSVGVEVGAGVSRFFGELFYHLLFLNLGLMAFNLLPLAPLDGSKILALFIPPQLEQKYADFLQHGPLLLLLLLLAERAFGFPLIVWWITWITKPILQGLTLLL